ncbi:MULTISPECIES: rod shape-determining protein MreC [unclassified Campylobacter]|uniref:rod shape-determining protein MreC n=1 Tax=unclassified Campylobacter TaxID=2593542 RepID=UPI0012381256|nr:MULTISPECIES: rod shape-determining protein MreC [unclassified Campylobacter]KAA6225184.1 rod shape-determining protein MreC [Campylobacter sp. LR196d]KAA6226196.1 rod shape-determining protein MreC [Campylobacter sp. LR185c]KAA6229004.1 rod shape-determining protein MreC [Campylobacter sp. LR286c]KAA6231397.1 rod shape-determining protein MreC [Campylobacter sp. LR264d]KAA6231609.1 rod shape-determining protein MreC [Campylobacter sp. LR291e]
MKNKVIYVLIFAFLVFVSFYYGGLIKKNVLVVNDYVIKSAYDFKDFVSEKISIHFNQIEQIENLKEKNEKLESLGMLVGTLSNEINRLLEDKNSTHFLPNVSLARVISYVQMNDYTKVWLDGTKSTPNKNKGLLYQGYSVGILIDKDARPMALLQGDEKCIFSVYIGDNKAPGFIQGHNGKIMVKYIPRWASFKVGDEILTSGLDNIFFAGVPVGVVTRVVDEDIYLSAEVKPYAQLNIPAYVYVIDRL